MSADKNRRHTPLAQFTGEYTPTPTESAEAESKSREIDARLLARAEAIRDATQKANVSGRGLSPEDEAYIRRKAATSCVPPCTTNLRPPSNLPPPSAQQVFERARKEANEAALLRMLAIHEKRRQSGKKSNGRGRMYDRSDWPALLLTTRSRHPRKSKAHVAHLIVATAKLPRISFSVVYKFVKENWDKA